MFALLWVKCVSPTGQLIQDHVEHLSGEAVEEARGGGTLAAGHDGSDGPRPLGRLQMMRLACPRVLPSAWENALVQQQDVTVVCAQDTDKERGMNSGKKLNPKGMRCGGELNK
ncbi:hypothetical protein XENORESO_001034 [Xenotaenia resolanae]|uniref:Uncharacterized protein n=1 Tax=Xenotaenia resolanae TaxID=208358 RepID=A0ABV0VUB9_9TELE